MADDVNQSAGQAEALKKINVPEGVVANDGDAAAKAYAEYYEKAQGAKDKISKFGADDLQSFLTRVGSDGVYAQHVVSVLLGIEDDKPASFFAGVSDAPQHQKSNGGFGNQTGKLDHSEVPAKKADLAVS